MKLIVLKETHQIKYIVDDDVEINVSERSIVLPGCIVSDMNESTAEIISVGSVPSDAIGNYYYNNTFLYENELELFKKKEALTIDLNKLRGEVAAAITEISLLNDGIPAELMAITPQIKELYAVAKAEIDSLTADNVDSYVLRGPQAQQLLTFLKSFL